MIKMVPPRRVVPMTMAVGGTALAIGSWIGAGWVAGISLIVVTVVATAGYVVLGRRDSDLGALSGGRPDERQVDISTRATVLTANVLVVVALVGVVVSTAAGTLVWPFLLFSVVAGVTYLVGLLIYRRQ